MHEYISVYLRLHIKFIQVNSQMFFLRYDIVHYF